jgi:hypothetical protein
MCARCKLLRFVEPIGARHLDIEQDDFWSKRRSGSEGLGSIRRLTDDFETLGLEKRAGGSTKILVIVDYKGGRTHTPTVACARYVHTLVSPLWRAAPTRTHPCRKVMMGGDRGETMVHRRQTGIEPPALPGALPTSVHHPRKTRNPEPAETGVSCSARVALGRWRTGLAFASQKPEAKARQ